MIRSDVATLSLNYHTDGPLARYDQIGSFVLAALVTRAK